MIAAAYMIADITLILKILLTRIDLCTSWMVLVLLIFFLP
jgi:hypothetical protein